MLHCGAAGSLLVYPRLSQREAGGGLWRSGHLVRITIIVWCIIALMSVGRAVLLHYPRHCGCYLIYAEAGRAWMGGDDLYTAQPGLSVYRYSPLVAVLLAPIGALPDMLGSGGASRGQFGHFRPRALLLEQRCRPVRVVVAARAAFLLLVAPLAARALIDVQVNGITIGAARLNRIRAEQVELGNSVPVFACLVNAYVISFVLVLMLLYPRQFLLRFVGDRSPWPGIAVCLSTAGVRAAAIRNLRSSGG